MINRRMIGWGLFSTLSLWLMWVIGGYADSSNTPVEQIKSEPVRLFTREKVGVAINLITDTTNGCQYIESYDAGLTPRLNADGKPYCDRTKISK